MSADITYLLVGWLFSQRLAFAHTTSKSDIFVDDNPIQMLAFYTITVLLWPVMIVLGVLMYRRSHPNFVPLSPGW